MSASTLLVTAIVATAEEARLSHLVEIARTVGWNVQPVSSGRELLVAAEALGDALLIVDVDLTDIDGFGLALLLGEQDPAHAYRLILVSAEASSDCAEIADALGLGAVLSLPLHPETLSRQAQALSHARQA